MCSEIYILKSENQIIEKNEKYQGWDAKPLVDKTML